MTSASRSLAAALVLVMGGCSVVLGIDNEYVRGGDGVGGESGGASSTAASSAEASSSSAASGAGGDAASGSGAGGAGGGAGGAGGGPVAVCGNGIIDLGEECDDKNAASNAYCVDCQVSCSGGAEHPTTHHCYIYSGKDGPGSDDGTAGWTSAKASCETLSAGAHLATLTTTDEISFVANAFLGSNDTWIGATDMVMEGTFAWVTGEAWTFPPSGGPWGENEPNGGGDCLKVKTNAGDAGEFEDGDCNNNFSFLCEIPPAGAAP